MSGEKKLSPGYSQEQAAEAISFARVKELRENPVQGNFDKAHLMEVHRRIFQDSPEHRPGQYREPAKGHYKLRNLETLGVGHSTPYMQQEKVDKRLDEVLDKAGGVAGFKNLSAKDFSAKMSKLYADLDHAHPFKEGNSRTLRTFTSQLAREAGYDLKWDAQQVGKQTRDVIYVARDVEVVKRHYPDLTEDKALNDDNISRREYEAYMFVIERYKNFPKLEQIVKDATFEEKDLEKANAFRNEKPKEAIKKHPELAGAYAQLEISEKKVEQDGLNIEQKNIVVNRVKEAIAQDLEKGKDVSAKIEQTKEVSRDVEADNDLER